MADIPVLMIGDLLLVSIQNELNDRIAISLQERILERLNKQHAPALLIDISSLDLVDSYIGRVLTETAQMVRLMNTDVVIVGMQPAVAITMTEMGLSLRDIKTASSLERGITALGYQFSKNVPDNDAANDAPLNGSIPTSSEPAPSEIESQHG